MKSPFMSTWTPGSAATNAPAKGSSHRDMKTALPRLILCAHHRHQPSRNRTLEPPNRRINRHKTAATNPATGDTRYFLATLFFNVNNRMGFQQKICRTVRIHFKRPLGKQTDGVDNMRIQPVQTSPFNPNADSFHAYHVIVIVIP